MQPFVISGIGRVGALAVALGVGAFIATNPAIASADASAGTTGSSEQSITHTNPRPKTAHRPVIRFPATAKPVVKPAKVTPAPRSPFAPIAHWVVLAWARREFEHALGVHIPAPSRQLATATQGTGAPFTVMTQNLYVGGDVGPTMRASTAQQSYQANTQLWNSVVATDFPTRSKALANQIGQTDPVIIGLQEATVWRDQQVSDRVTGTTTPNADHVVYDQVTLLQADLAAGGTPYVVAAHHTTSDIEGARINPDSPNGYTDIRRTSSDVILVRADQADRISNPQSGQYLAKSIAFSPNGVRMIDRSWAAVDYRVDDTHTVRVFSTHIEPIVTPLSLPAQTLQAVELLLRVYASPHSVVVMGDLNSPDNIPLTPAYWILRAGLGDAWWSTHPLDFRGSCCQAPLLDNPKSSTLLRLDHVLVRGVTADSAALTGTEPFRQSPPPLWASDHYGVASTLHVTGGPPWLWLARLVPFVGPLV